MLPFSDDGFVRYVEVLVLLHERRAIAISRVGYFQHEVLPDGSLDRAHLAAVMSAAGNAALGPIGESTTSPVVVQAGYRFAKRELENLNFWKPTEADKIALRDLVNAKARRPLM